MKGVRKPAVAGKFYPSDPTELRRMVGGYLKLIKSPTQAPKAMIVPHAGYPFSGPVAATAYASIASAGSSINRVVLLGPAHFVSFDGLAYHGADTFLTPLGPIPIDCATVEALDGLSQVHHLDAAHDSEHSLEVQLPFLMEVLKDFSLIPLVVGNPDPWEVSEVLQKVWGGPETLIVVSSDLSHYHDYETAKRLDASTSKLIETLRLEEIRSDDACGSCPIKGLLKEARVRGMGSLTVDLRNSGDTEGPRDKVVGYGAFLFYE